MRWPLEDGIVAPPNFFPPFADVRVNPPVTARSPSGRRLATSHPDGVYLLDTQGSSAPVRIAAREVLDVVFEGDDHLVVVDEGSRLRVVGSRGEELWSRTAAPNAIAAAATAPDGEIVTAGADGCIRSWSALRDGPRTLACTGASYHTIAASPDGRVAAAGREGKAHLLDGVRVRDVSGPSGARDLTFASSHVLLTSGLDTDVIAWTEAGPRTAARHAAAVWAVRSAPDGRSFASASRGEVRVTDLAALGHGRAFLGGDPSVSDLTYSADGRWLAIAGASSVRAFDLERWQSGAFPLGHRVIWSVQPLGQDHFLAACRDGSVVDVSPGRSAEVIARVDANVFGAVATRDGGRVYFADAKRNLHRTDRATGAVRRLATFGSDLNHMLALAPDETWIATTGQDGTRLFHEESGAEKPVPRGGSLTRTGCFTEDGWLVAAGAGGAEALHPTAGSRSLVLDGDAYAACFGARAMVVARGQAVLWTPAHGQRQMLAPLPGAPVAIAARADTAVAALSGGQLVELVAGGWRSLNEGEPQDFVQVELSPDGRSVAARTWTSLFLVDRVRRTASRRRDARDGVNRFAFAPDGATLVVPDRDGLVRTYRVPPRDGVPLDAPALYDWIAGATNADANERAK
jgi:WD40 repeat protein